MKRSKRHDSNEELTWELILLESIHQDMVSKSEIYIAIIIIHLIHLFK